MATQISNYYLSDAAVMAEAPETIDALDDLMHKVSHIPGVTVAMYETPDVIHGTKIVIRKELANAQ